MKETAEQLLHSTLGFLHIFAAVTWVGSTMYQQFGVTPALRKLGDAKAHAMGGLPRRTTPPGHGGVSSF